MADAKTAKINRLNRIAGQVRGLAQMIEDDRYCMDILHHYLESVETSCFWPLYFISEVGYQILVDNSVTCSKES